MSVAVSLPTRMRVDRKALIERANWIDAALSTALGRAIANSRKVVLDPRGDYLDVIALAPQFSWRGLPVDQELRGAWERRISDLYDSLLAGNGIGRARAEAPEVIPPDPSETFDQTRGHGIGGVYIVDSYAGGTDSVPIKGDTKPFENEYVSVVKVVSGFDDQEMLAKLFELAGDATPDNPLGVIFRVGKGWQLLITNGEDLDKPLPVGAFAFEGFHRRQYLGPNAKPPYRQVAYTPPPAAGTAEIIDIPGGQDGLKSAMKDLLGANFNSWLRQHWAKPVSMTTPKYQAAVADVTDQFIETHGREVARTNPTKAVRVRLGSSEVVIWADKDSEPFLRWDGIAKLTPIEAFVRQPKQAKQSGKGGGGSRGGVANGKAAGGRPGGTGLCPHDERPDDHPPDDVEGSIEDLPFLGEPSLDEIGDAGVTLGAKISALARKLNIPECKFAGQFCYHAARELLAEARYTQWMDETSTGANTSNSGSKGNLGVLEFTPSKSPIIERIRELAAIVPQLSDLILWVEAIYESQTYRCSIHGIWRGQGSSWALRFLEEVVPVIKDAIGQMFLGACRSSLLQLLATSLIEIEKRQKALPRYAPLFERWIVPMIANMAELETMRRLLRDYKIDKVVKPVLITTEVVTGQIWVAAGTALVTTLKGGFTRQAGAAYDFVEDGGVTKIRDRKSMLWSSEDLENALKLNGQIAEGADPLVKQIVDTPEAIQRFKDSESIHDELEKLLKEMVDNNREMKSKTTDDVMFAFKASRIDEDIPAATISGSKYSLQGIHKVAHEQIGDAFGKTGFYGAGIDDLFDSEEGKAALKGAAIMTAFVVLCVLVPGGGFIAFAAGGALATHELGAAYEKKRLYRSLINPDLVLTSAEVEVALFVAWFGVVMSAIPEAGTAVKGLIAGGRAIVKGETKMLGKMAAKSIATRVSKELAEYAVKDLLEAFVKETVINFVTDQVIQQVMKPLIARVEHEASFGFGNAGSAVATEPPDDGGEQDFIEMILDSEEFEQ